MENNNIEKKENKEPMTTKQKVFFGLRIAFNVVFYGLIIFLFLFSIMNIRGGNGTTSFPNIFGRGFLSVQSDSMERDESKKASWPKEWENYEIGGFTTGDLLNVKTFDESDASELKVGDVITFQWNVNGQSALNTHRIVEIHKQDGKVDYVIAQGDRIAQTIKYNSEASALEKYSWESSGTIQTVRVDAIRGVVTSINSGAGKTLDTIQKNWLFIFVIPIIVLLVIEVFLVVRNIMILRGEKNKLELADSKEAMMNEVEAEREKMRQELLAELRAQGLAPQEDTKPTEEVKEETPVEDVAVVQEEPETKEELVSEEKPEEVKPEEPQVEETKVEEPVQEETENTDIVETTEEVKEESEPQEEVKDKEE